MQSYTSCKGASQYLVKVREIIRVLSCPFQVFLELSREQEKDNFDLTLDGTFEWKQLQQEDC